MNRRNRSYFGVLLLATVGSHLAYSGQGAMAWIFAALHFLLYPQLVYVACLRSNDQRRTEMNSLLVDGLLLGMWAGGLGFPVWISFICMVAVTVNLTVFRGRIGFLQAWMALGAGAALGQLAMGFPLSPDTGWPTTFLAILSISAYVIVVAESGYARAVQLHEARARLRANELELKRQLQEISALQARLREQANRDPLTGLYNRRYVDDTLERELQRCERDGEALAVVLLDIDNFKDVNDIHGHQAGDEVLKMLAQLLSRHVRGGDVASRYGGEEFMLLLPGTDAKVAAHRAQEWREAFASQSVLFQEARIVTTLSVGIAAYPVHGSNAAELIRAADLALYRAKANGRNEVRVFAS